MRRILFVLSFILAPFVAHAQSTEIGKASYYSSAEIGHKTASGERYDPKKLTAASRKYPLGTVLKVINLRNHHEVIVRVNDVGPFVHKRVIDLSASAASKLGFIHAGLTIVKIIPINFAFKPHRSYYNNA